LANVIDILDPDMIVLGGGVSNIDFLYDEGKNFVYEKVFSDTIDTPIVKNKLGDSAGVFGACLL
jgi:fructokinase